MGWALDNLGAGECERIAVELIGEVKPAGQRLQARCPFPGHADQHPSFYYNPSDDYYRCYSHPNSGEEAGDLVDHRTGSTGPTSRPPCH